MPTTARWIDRRKAILMLAGACVVVSFTGCAGINDQALSVTLTQMARDIFPHRAVPESVYTNIIKNMLGSASAEQRAHLRSGAEQLAGDGKTLWHERAEAERLLTLKAIETTPFFIGVRMATLFGLYADMSVVRGFGYPGPSVDFGGYLNAGFNDLNWLPEPTS